MPFRIMIGYALLQHSYERKRQDLEMPCKKAHFESPGACWQDFCLQRRMHNTGELFLTQANPSSRQPRGGVVLTAIKKLIKDEPRAQPHRGFPADLCHTAPYPPALTLRIHRYSLI